MKHIISVLTICLFISMFISCNASVSGLQITPGVYDFGRINLGSEKDMFFRVNNVSNTSFKINSVDLLGVDATSFYLTTGGAYSRTISSGSSVVIGVKFIPQRTGLHNVYLQISHTGTKGYERVYITATGQAAARIALSINELNYEKTYLANPKALEIEVTNTGTATLVLNKFGYTYPNVTQFSIKSGGTIPVIMSVGTSHTIQVEFAPDSESTFYNELLIYHNGVETTDPLKVKLRGTGVNYAPEIKFSQTSPWDLGTHSNASPSIHDLVITSDGIDALTINSTSFATGTYFSVSGYEDKNGSPLNLPQTVQPGDTLTVKVQFSPSGNQAFNDTLTINHDGINEVNNYDFAIEGTGRDPITKTFTYTGAIENWNVPPGVTRMTFEVWGAQGAHYNNLGGKGAYLKGDFTVTPGETLKILVGERGKNGTGGGTNYQGGGGGGGSFVCRSNNDPMIIAGGGGGYLFYNSAPTTHDGRITTDGGDTYNNGGGDNGQGGDYGQTNGPAAGGGGLLSDGKNYSSYCYGGKAFVNGGAGGQGYGTSTSYTGGDGGFGGGGGGYHNSINRCGGGGGYSGGQGGTCSGQAAGGGGGSINNGTNQTNTAAVQTGDGKIVVTY